MASEVTFFESKKYDVTERVFQSLADIQSRVLLFSLVKEGKTALELAKEHKVPLSTVYKKLSDLEEISLVIVERWIFSADGRKVKVYRSRISEASINLNNIEPVVNLAPNPRRVEKSRIGDL